MDHVLESRIVKQITCSRYRRSGVKSSRRSVNESIRKKLKQSSNNMASTGKLALVNPYCPRDQSDTTLMNVNNHVIARHFSHLS
jgi:hypothetical protein